jgi:hypothetical protein
MSMKKVSIDKINKEEEVELIQRQEVAEILGISGQQVDRYRKEHLITSVQYKTRGVHRYNKAAILAFKNGKV